MIRGDVMSNEFNDLLKELDLSSLMFLKQKRKKELQELQREIEDGDTSFSEDYSFLLHKYKLLTDEIMRRYKEIEKQPKTI